MLTFQLRLFGEFKEIGRKISVEIDQNQIRSGELKRRIMKHFEHEGVDVKYLDLLHESVLANEEKVLDENDFLQESCFIALLPPVAGG